MHILSVEKQQISDTNRNYFLQHLLHTGGLVLNWSRMIFKGCTAKGGSLDPSCQFAALTDHPIPYSA